MRGWIVLLGTAALAACGRDNQADGSQDLNRSLTAQNIVANDVTAIDAVTGDAANMAADVDFTDALANELGPADGNATASRPRRPAAQGTPPARRVPRSSAPAPSPEPAPATEPAANQAE